MEDKMRDAPVVFPNGFDEKLKWDLRSPYGCSKGAADQYMQDYARMFGLKTVIFRHSSMFGGRQFSTYDQGWIGWFCLKALEMDNPDASPFTISGDGKQVRDVLNADDLVRVYMAAFESIERTAGQVYNIGAGDSNSLSLLELFKMLEELTGTSMRFRRLDWRLGDQKYFVANYRKATREFGWVPKINKTNGIARMLEWCRELVGAGT